MKKRIGFTVLITGAVIPSCILGLYLMLSAYYANGFAYDTWVNGVYCTGKSVEQANDALVEVFDTTHVEINYPDGTVEKIALDKIGFSVDYKEPLKLLIDRQSSLFWIFYKQKDAETVLAPNVVIDEEALLLEIKNLSAVKKAGISDDKTVEIVKTKHGYVLNNEKADVLNASRLAQKVSDELKAGNYSVSVEQDCYEDMPLNAEELKTLELWKQVDAFQTCNIQYDISGEFVPIDSGVVCEWIMLTEEGEFFLDEDGQLVLDESKIKEFVASLAEKYDTLGAERTFWASRGEQVTVSGGNYGNKINQKAEVDFLKDAVKLDVAQTRIPQYSKEALYQGKNDIGSTYIEIDLKNQMMYYYTDGFLYVETPVVTGNIAANHDTPEGVCYVNAKQTSRILRGPDYESFVNFWVPVWGDIGIHDAPWRGQYGGQIYKTNGSHGCINTPYDAMKKIYEHVEIGTPVIIFY